MVANIPEAISPAEDMMATRRPIPGFLKVARKPPDPPPMEKLIGQNLVANMDAIGLIIHMPPNRKRNALIASVLRLSRKVKRGICKMAIIACKHKGYYIAHHIVGTSHEADPSQRMILPNIKCAVSTDVYERVGIFSNHPWQGDRNQS